MKRRWSTWLGLGIAEVSALAVLWRSAKAAPLVAFEHDVDLVTRRPDRAAGIEPAARAV